MPKELEKVLVSNFTSTISELKSEKEVLSFFESFLTKEELSMLSKRLAVLYLLSKEVSYSKIASTLRITPATIVKLAKILRREKPRFAHLFSLLDRHDGRALLKLF